METPLSVFRTLAGLAGENSPGLARDLMCARDLLCEELGWEPDRLRVLNLNLLHLPHLFIQRRRNQISVSMAIFPFRKFPQKPFGLLLFQLSW